MGRGINMGTTGKSDMENTEKREVSEEKKNIVNELKDKIENSRILIVLDYRGTKVNDVTEFKKKLFTIDSSMKIYKNTLTRIAFEELKVEYPSDMFKGPTAILSTDQDVVSLSKQLSEFKKENDFINLKGGYFNKSFVDEKTIDTLAKLPSRDVLLAKVVGGIKSPIVGLVNVLSGPTRGLVYALDSIKQKK